MHFVSEKPAALHVLNPDWLPTVLHPQRLKPPYSIESLLFATLVDIWSSISAASNLRFLLCAEVKSMSLSSVKKYIPCFYSFIIFIFIFYRGWNNPFTFNNFPFPCRISHYIFLGTKSTIKHILFKTYTLIIKFPIYHSIHVHVVQHCMAHYKSNGCRLILKPIFKTTVLILHMLFISSLSSSHSSLISSSFSSFSFIAGSSLNAASKNC